MVGKSGVTDWVLYNKKEKHRVDNLDSSQLIAVYSSIPVSQRKDWFAWKEGYDSWRQIDELTALRPISNWQKPEPVEEPDVSQQMSLDEMDVKVFPGREVTQTGSNQALSEEVPFVIDETEADMQLINFDDSEIDDDEQIDSPLPNESPINRFPEGFKAESIDLKDSDHNLPEYSIVTGLKTLAINYDPVKSDNRRSEPRYIVKFAVEIKIGSRVFITASKDVSVQGIRLETRLPEWVPRKFPVTVRNAEGGKVVLFCERQIQRPEIIHIIKSDSLPVFKRWMTQN